VKRVLQINKYYPPWIGGVEQVVSDLAEGLASEFEMAVLACDLRRRGVERSAAGCGVTRSFAPAALLSMPLSAQFVSDFYRLSRKADVLHFHHPFPLAEAAALLEGCRGRKVVVTYHSDIVRQAWLKPLYQPILSRFLGRCDRIIVSSRTLLEHSEPLRPFLGRCSVVPFGIRDPGPAGEVDPVDLPAEGYVLFVGRLVPYKGVEYLLEAMTSVGAPLVIVGDGPLRPALERLADRLGVGARTRFLGRLSPPRLRSVFSRSSVFVLPSVAANEAFGLVQLEAMSFGKPVVNTQLPTGVPEVSPNDVTGLTVPPRDAAALAEALRKILGDGERRARYGRAAVQRAGELSMARFLERMRVLYGEVLSGS
jgi:rhamnosyl/mannosyltransferase